MESGRGISEGASHPPVDTQETNGWRRKYGTKIGNLFQRNKAKVDGKRKRNIGRRKALASSSTPSMDAFRKEKIALRLMAVTLPKDLPSFWLKAAVDLYFCLEVSALGFWSFLYFRGAYLYVHENFLSRMVGLCAAISVSGSIAKLVTFKFNSALLKELFEQLGYLVADTDRGKTVRKVTSLYQSAVAAIILTHNYEYFIRSTPTRSSPYYTQTQTGSAGEVALDYWFTLYSAIITLTANVIGDTVFLIITNQVCHRLLLLSNTVSTIGTDGPKVTMEAEGIKSDQGLIKKCVQEHNTLLIIKNKLENLYNYIITVQLGYSFSTICLTLFVISQYGDVYIALQELLPQTFSLFLEIFLYCWAGQMLNNHFEELRLAVYSSGWYNCSAAERSSILIMQAFTTKPVQVTSMSVFHLNFHLYETICREAFSYYTIMSQLFSQ